MVLQSTMFPDKVCSITELYFRTTGKIEKSRILLLPGQTASTDTYMNAVDLGHWNVYTTAFPEQLKLCAMGRFLLSLYVLQKEKETEVYRAEYIGDGESAEEIFLPEDIREGILFWKIQAITNVTFYSARYETLQKQQGREIRAALNICTYHRNAQIEKNLDILRKSAFFQLNNALCGRIHIYVTDNGGDFQCSIKSPYIRVFQNGNKGGGTGGFTRGLKEMNQNYDAFPYTHTIFMDDDVEFQIESFYRLFVFLSFLKEQYQMNPVAGRMFRRDKKNIQYTAAEQWNQGNILHIEGNQNMSLKECLFEETGITGEYGGWWFCCYPSETTRKYRPFPFFLHCDDAEYGLRQKKEALILRGVQVWHETFEYRISPQIVYYDIRNGMIVNAVYGHEKDYEEILRSWRQRTTDYHNQNEQKMKYMAILAMWDFLSGNVGMKRQGKISKAGLKISDFTEILRWISPIFRRITEIRIKSSFMRAATKYKERTEKELWQ